MRRLGRLARRLTGLAWLAAAAWWCLVAIAALVRSRWASGPLYGFAPWGDAYGVRITPLSVAETRDAQEREWMVLAGGPLLTPSGNVLPVP